MVIRIAIPNKGRLREPAIRLLGRIGLEFPTTTSEGGLLVETQCGRYRILSVNARDVPSYVSMGAADCAITGTDLLAESGLDLPVPLLLEFGKARLVLAVPQDAEVLRCEELRSGARIATVYPNITNAFFRDRHQSVEVIPVSGAVEAAPGMGIADAILDISDTGTTLRNNGLRVVETVLSTQAGLVTRHGLSKEADLQVQELSLALQSVARAARCRYLMANVPRKLLAELPALLPGVEGPTVIPLLGRDDWVAVHAVVAEDEVNGVVAVLKRGGATGILIAPLERMVL